MPPGGLWELQWVLHVQFALHRYFSGKLNVFYYDQTITSTYTVVICVRLQWLRVLNKNIVFKATQVSASHLFCLSRELLQMTDLFLIMIQYGLKVAYPGQEKK